VVEAVLTLLLLLLLFSGLGLAFFALFRLGGLLAGFVEFFGGIAVLVLFGGKVFGGVVLVLGFDGEFFGGVAEPCFGGGSGFVLFEGVLFREGSLLGLFAILAL